MLLKISSTEVGRFEKLIHKAPHFTKLTLIYAKNGFGKTTICSMLASAASVDAQGIKARKRLGAKSDPAISVYWDPDKTASFVNGKWNKCPGPVLVFNQDYVEKNVHVAGNVTRDNKRGLLSVMVGQKGVQLAADIDKVDQRLISLRTEQTQLERTIRQAKPIVSDVGAFCAAKVPDDIDAQIETAKRTAELGRQAGTVTKRQSPPILNCPTFEELEQIFARKMPEISDTAAQDVASHLKRFSMSENGERWLRYGAAHIVDNCCPFCAQNVDPSTIAKTVQNFFSEAYDRHVRSISDALCRCEALYGDNGASLRAHLSQASTEFQFWSSVCEVDKCPIGSEKQINEAICAFQSILSALRRKHESPLSSVSIAPNSAEARAALNLIRELNDSIERSEAAISRARLDAAAVDAHAAEDALSRKEALKSKLAAPLKDSVLAYTAMDEEKCRLEARKSQLQADLRSYVRSTVSTREAEINRVLGLFGANFSIAETKASFVGREPNAEFCLEMSKQKIKVGLEKLDEPCFKTVLSGGDKFSLALAFFFSQINSDPLLGDSVVVFDDPFSSQDLDRQFETASLIRQVAADACQVLVLSHDPRFLNLIEKDADHSICSAFQVSYDSGDQASIRPWSSAEELKSNYTRRAERIRYFANHGMHLKGGLDDSLAQDIRPFLEDYIRLRFPGRFKDAAMLWDMTSVIEEAGPSDPLYPHVQDLKALNSYTRTFMHGGAPSASSGELRSQCRKVQSIVGHF